jgi:UDP-N-acetylmuramoylalanine-D-glutamate ligase
MTQLDLLDGAMRDSAFLDQLAGRPVTVIGTARAASASAKIMHAAGARVRVEPVSTESDLTGDALVIVTVATALRASAVVAAREAGVVVLGDLDLAWLASGADAFAVTGGAHAGRAAELAATLLAAHNRSIVAFGDDAVAGAREGDVLLVEPSLGQLSAMQVFRPRVAVILRGAPPLAVRLFAHQTPQDCLVLADDPELCSLARASRAHVVWLSPEHVLDHGVYVAQGRIAARLNGRVEDICAVDGIPGNELEAALAAVACGLWAGLDLAAIGGTLVQSFAVERGISDRLRTPVVLGRMPFSAAGARVLAARARAMLGLMAGRRGAA